MAHSDLYAADHHWGDTPIDLTAKDLPALKAQYLVSALPDEGRVLEIGCGGGRLLNTIAAHRPRLRLDGCDVRPIQGTPAHFQFALVDPEQPDLPYPDATFDAVVMFDVLEHVVDPAGMVDAARSVLRDDGRFVSFTPLENETFSAYRIYRRLFGDDLYVETKEHVQSFAERDVRHLLRSRFEITDVEYAYHVVGHVMDATLFALTRVPAIRRRFWESNPYYREQESAVDRPSSALSTLMQFANALAYAESRLLRRHRLGAAGMLFRARAR